MIVQKDGAYFIALPAAYSLEDILSYRRSLTEVLKMASLSDIYDGSGQYMFDVLDLLQLLEVTPTLLDDAK